MRRPNKTWLVRWTLRVSIAHGLVATGAGVDKKGAFTDDALPPLNHVAQCPKTRSTFQKRVAHY